MRKLTQVLSWASMIGALLVAILVQLGQNATPNEKPGQGATTLPATQPASGLVQIVIPVGRPLYTATPKNKKVDGPVETPRKKGEPRPPFLAPRGTVNLALKRPVTSSDKEPIIGTLEQVTDGDREGSEGSWIELVPGPQWVQIDLGKPCEIWGISVWHYYDDPGDLCVYKDIIVQVSDDPNFITGVTTVFNNDHDNSSGLGVGKALMYFESHEGKLIETKGQAKGRYVRLYSRGSAAGDENRYIEVEVYGIPAK